MTNRERFINYGKNGDKKVICSPQIGASVGFDPKMAGKTWFSQTTPQNFVPVVDNLGSFIGILTRRGILRYFCHK